MPDFADLLTARATPQSTFEQNKKFINQNVPQNYNTALPMADELAFRAWLKKNNVPFDPEAKVSDYDMRGFFKALSSGDPAARTAVNQFDSQLHYPDKWKTPYHESFSNESQWANANAPRWGDGDILSDSSGRVIFRPR